MRRVTRPWVSAAATALVLTALAATVMGCGSSSSSSKASPTATATSSAAVAQITANWESFFAGTTPAARKISLLQNAQQFAQTIQAQAKSVIAQASQAKVSAVTVTSASTAMVTYSILLSGKVALADQTGQAVLESGVWKVSAKSFADLLALEGQQTSQSSPSATP